MDDLVKRLRNHIAVVIDNKGHVFESETLCDETADRIEELEANNAALGKMLVQFVLLAQDAVDVLNEENAGLIKGEELSRRLAELKGENDE